MRGDSLYVAWGGAQWQFIPMAWAYSSHALPYCTHGDAIYYTWRCHSSHMAPPFITHGVAILYPWQCHGLGAFALSGRWGREHKCAPRRGKLHIARDKRSGIPGTQTSRIHIHPEHHPHPGAPSHPRRHHTPGTITRRAPSHAERHHIPGHTNVNAHYVAIN